MTELIDFLNQTTIKYYEKIPTYSTHSTIAKKTINEVINEYPEYSNIIEALICYPIQRWAEEIRNELKIDSKSIKNIIKYEDDAYFGIKNLDFLEKQTKLLEISNRALNFITDTLTDETLLAVHGYKEKDISKYKMIQYYKPALINYCEINYKKYKKIVSPLVKEYKKMEDDIQFVYHSSAILLKLKSILKNRETGRYEPNYEKTIEMIDKCIGSLEGYYINDPKIVDVARLYSEGHKEVYIANKIGKSRTYVRNLYKDAVCAIAYVVWGYTTHNIINNCK